jgi:hypothetical protein
MIWWVGILKRGWFIQENLPTKGSRKEMENVYVGGTG